MYLKKTYFTEPRSNTQHFINVYIVKELRLLSL